MPRTKRSISASLRPNTPSAIADPALQFPCAANETGPRVLGLTRRESKPLPAAVDRKSGRFWASRRSADKSELTGHRFLGDATNRANHDNICCYPAAVLWQRQRDAERSPGRTNLALGRESIALGPDQTNVKAL